MTAVCRMWSLSLDAECSSIVLFESLDKHRQIISTDGSQFRLKQDNVKIKIRNKKIKNEKKKVAVCKKNCGLLSLSEKAAKKKLGYYCYKYRREKRMMIKKKRNLLFVNSNVYRCR